MKPKKIVLLALLVAMGAVLHAVVPGVFFGMKPDMMLTMMFLGILLFPDTKSVFLLGVTTGVISAMTTSFPAGQIPNIVDKFVTAFVFYGLVLLVKNISKTYVKTLVLTAIGTLVSGSVFLGTAMLIAQLPGGATFLAMFSVVVLPTILVNTIVMAIVYPIAMKLFVRMKSEDKH